MKKYLIIIAFLISSLAYSQGPQTSYTVTSIAAMKTYFGKESRIHVTATNEDFVNSPASTPDEVTIYDGAGTRVWKKVRDMSIDAGQITSGTIATARLPEFVLSSSDFDGAGTSGDPITILGKQATLVSGTNIKTVNGTTLLGSGDLVISGGSGADALGRYVVQIATNAPANAQILASLSTGILKVTTTTGVLSTAVGGDFPTLNQNTTGSAATLTTPRLIEGVSFNGSADIVTDRVLTVYGILGGAIKAEPVVGRLFNMTTVAGMADNVIRWTMVYLPKAATITGVKWFQGTQGAYTADGYNGVGLYSVSGGTLTLVASSTNDGNIWKAAGVTVGSKAFSSTYAAAAGVYVVAALYCHSAETTAPDVGVLPNIANSTVIPAFDFTNSAKLFGTLLSQTSLPASQAFSGVNGTSTPFYFAIY